MGQPFNCISQAAQAEISYSEHDLSRTDLSTGIALPTDGARLAAVGALTGAALYEALRSLIEKSSAAVATGNVGSAIRERVVGVEMASMAADGDVFGLGIAGFHLLKEGIDLEKLLGSAIDQMETDLQNTRRAAVHVLASQKMLQYRYKQTQAEVEKWEQRAQLALQKGNEFLAQAALSRKHMHSEVLSSFNFHLGSEPGLCERLKSNVVSLAAQILEARATRNSLNAAMAAIKLNGQQQAAVEETGIGSATAAFKQIEGNTRKIETNSQAEAEPSQAEQAPHFNTLPFGHDVDAELSAMKAQLLETPQPRLSVELLPQTEAELADLEHQFAALDVGDEIDKELAAMKAQLLKASEQSQL